MRSGLGKILRLVFGVCLWSHKSKHTSALLHPGNREGFHLGRFMYMQSRLQEAQGTKAEKYSIRCIADT